MATPALRRDWNASPCRSKFFVPGHHSSFALVFVLLGLIVAGPGEAMRGIGAILVARDALLTDYLGIAGIGGGLVHADLLALPWRPLSPRFFSAALRFSPFREWSWQVVPAC